MTQRAMQELRECEFDYIRDIQIQKDIKQTATTTRFGLAEGPHQVVLITNVSSWICYLFGTGENGLTEG